MSPILLSLHVRKDNNAWRHHVKGAEGARARFSRPTIGVDAA